MKEFKKMELTSNDVISESALSLADFIIEARKVALKEEIRANTVLIDKTFAKVNDIHFVVGSDILHIPPMICGLEVHLTDELPDGYDFAVVETPETVRDRIVRQAKSEVAREIFEEIEKILNESRQGEYSKELGFLNRVSYNGYVLCKGLAELKKKYTDLESGLSQNVGQTKTLINQKKNTEDSNV